VRVIQHCCLENCRYLIQSLLERLETVERILWEEHAKLGATLDKLHCFQCHIWERIVGVWQGQKFYPRRWRSWCPGWLISRSTSNAPFDLRRLLGQPQTTQPPSRQMTSMTIGVFYVLLVLCVFLSKLERFWP